MQAQGGVARPVKTARQALVVNEMIASRVWRPGKEGGRVKLDGKAAPEHWSSPGVPQ